MRTSQTTIAGRVAGLTLALTAAPGLPSWLTGSLTVVAALAVIYLGHRAADCPVNCPGTGPGGQPRDDVHQRRLPVRNLALAVTLLALTSGCTTPNPAYTPGQTNAPAYIVSPAVAAWSNSIVPVAQTIGEVAGTGSALPEAIAGVFALVAAISVAVARKRSATAATLAASVHDAGPEAVADALAYASDTNHYAAVAAALNEHHATGQAPGRPPTDTPKKGG
jgi:hypothetical protein